MYLADEPVSRNIKYTICGVDYSILQTFQQYFIASYNFKLNTFCITTNLLKTGLICRTAGAKRQSVERSIAMKISQNKTLFSLQNQIWPTNEDGIVSDNLGETGTHCA